MLEIVVWFSVFVVSVHELFGVERSMISAFCPTVIINKMLKRNTTNILIVLLLLNFLSKSESHIIMPTSIIATTVIVLAIKIILVLFPSFYQAGSKKTPTSISGEMNLTALSQKREVSDAELRKSQLFFYK